MGNGGLNHKIPYKYYLTEDKYCYVEPFLQYQLDSMVVNLKKDWDFIIVISGNRQTRTGKSVLAMNIAGYLAYRLKTPYTVDNIFFRSKEMMAKAKEFPKHSIIHYDEGRESLASNKFASQIQKDLLDFFDRYAQKNHIWIIVLPDFFDLKEQMAVAKSEMLINCYRNKIKMMKDCYNEGFKRPVVRLERGHYWFYSEEKKKRLYDTYKRTNRKSYLAVRGNFMGNFPNNYPIDETEYRKRKADDADKEEEKFNTTTREKVFRDYIIKRLYMKGMKPIHILESLEHKFNYIISDKVVYKVINDYKKKGELPV